MLSCRKKQAVTNIFRCDEIVVLKRGLRTLDGFASYKSSDFSNGDPEFNLFLFIFIDRLFKSETLPDLKSQTFYTNLFTIG